MRLAAASRAACERTRARAGPRLAHRDLKLENFLYERSDGDHLKIIDFGFAEFTGETMSRACGSLDYVAPEVLAKARSLVLACFS